MKRARWRSRLRPRSTPDVGMGRCTGFQSASRISMTRPAAEQLRRSSLFQESDSEEGCGRRRKTQGGRCDCRRQNQHAPARDGDDRARERFRPRAAILWLSHPGITTRSVTDTAVVLNALAGQDGKGARQEFHAEALRETKLRVGVADNFKAQPEITDAFKRAIESMRALGHAIATAHAPFEIPPFGDLRAIQEDRETIADRAFKDVDVIVLPTTATIVLAVKDASANKLLWTAGHQRSLRCRSARPSDGTADRRQASR